MYSYAVVQITANRFKKGESVSSGYLEGLVPIGKPWGEVTTEPRALTTGPRILLSHDYDSDCEMTEDAIGLEFKSVGDWAGYGSFFDHEVDQVGILEVVESYLSEIMEAVYEKVASTINGVGKRHFSIVTLWSIHMYRCMDEDDYDINYHGPFKLRDVRKLIK